MSKIVNVILSGGVGSRLWPLSRKDKPKQYLNIFEGNSLFDYTIKRNKKIADSVLLVGSVQNIDLAKEALKDEKYEIIVESVPRNTAAAIAFGAFALEQDDIMIVSPSDHLVDNLEKYEEAIQQGVKFAKEGYLSTFGIRPTYPESGYGYIEHDGNDVLSFREKPSEQVAKEFLKQGVFLWNSGIFCFKAGVYLDELAKYAPKVYKHSKLAYENSKQGILPESLSMEIPSISIDYAVMEKSEKIKVVPSDFRWSDMGSFESLYTYFVDKGHPIDDKGNMVIGDNNNQLVRFVGLENVIIVNSKDALLVLNKSAAQDVKAVYEDLEKEKPEYT